MPLHQSAFRLKTLNHVVRSVWTHSSLICCADQDGELTAVHGALLHADRDVIRDLEDAVAHASKT